MASALWRFIALPLLHWLVVSLAILAIGKLAEAKRLVDEAGQAIAAPIKPKMAELAFQVTRADGTVEPPRVYRTYRNPLRQWAWAIKKAMGTEFLACAGRGASERKRMSGPEGAGNPRR